MELTNHSSLQSFRQYLSRIQIRRNLVFGIIIIGALIAFEIFNYSTTDYALTDLLGNLEFAGLRWATILSIAFCGIDFAGIARLFTPDDGNKDAHEAWYLFGAWMLAATMNAILTWWGVSMAVINHSVQSNGVIDAASVSRIVPIFVALMVWVIRILIIGSLSYNSSRIFSAQAVQADHPRRTVNAQPTTSLPARTLSTPAPAPRTPAYTPVVTSSAPVSQAAFSAPTPTAAPIRPAPKPAPRSESPFVRPEAMTNRPEPTYHSVAAAPRNGGNETHQF
ncbi:MAG TPA: hypothetical protein PKW33_07575 [Anaerolineaceae bacterium]|nr:hypothetical protein [Anaerolineaceae bacterium]HPN51431.1 hypothetical protein [Anaerolineaceae bacterium]